MNNIEVFNSLIERYNTYAATHNYIYGFTSNGMVYMAFADNTSMPYISKLDRASRGAGYSLRFRSNKNIKAYMLNNMRTVALCSKTYFEDTVRNSKYNRGEVFENMVANKYGIKWEKNNLKFWEAPDLVIDGIAYQLKFEKGTYTNEKTLANIEKRG